MSAPPRRNEDRSRSPAPNASAAAAAKIDVKAFQTRTTEQKQKYTTLTNALDNFGKYEKTNITLHNALIAVFQEEGTKSKSACKTLNKQYTDVSSILVKVQKSRTNTLDKIEKVSLNALGYMPTKLESHAKLAKNGQPDLVKNFEYDRMKKTHLAALHFMN